MLQKWAPMPEENGPEGESVVSLLLQTAHAGSMGRNLPQKRRCIEK